MVPLLPELSENRVFCSRLDWADVSGGVAGDEHACSTGCTALPIGAKSAVGKCRSYTSSVGAWILRNRTALKADTKGLDKQAVLQLCQIPILSSRA